MCRNELEGYYTRFGFRRVERAEMPAYEEEVAEAERDRQATNRGGVASAMIFVGEELARRYGKDPRVIWLPLF